MDDAGLALDAVLPAETISLAPGLLAAVTQDAEQHGYARVFLPDHILPPAPYGDPITRGLFRVHDYAGVSVAASCGSIRLRLTPVHPLA